MFGDRSIEWLEDRRDLLWRRATVAFVWFALSIVLVWMSSPWWCLSAIAAGGVTGRSFGQAIDVGAELRRRETFR